MTIRRGILAFIFFNLGREMLYLIEQTHRWYNAQISKDPSKENYINDIRRAWLGAEEVNVYGAEHDQPIPLMHREIRSLLSPSIPNPNWILESE